MPVYSDLLRRPEIRVYKSDARSRVWGVRAEEQENRRAENETPLTQPHAPLTAQAGYVIKRFEYSPWRQQVVRLVNQHPAQREVAWNRRLRDAGFAVVPIVAQGVDGLGRSWLVTPFIGMSLFHWVMDTPVSRESLRQRRDLARQLAQMVGLFLRLRLRHGDFKASNLVLDAQGKLHMIDVGAVKGCKGVPLLALALRMLTTLHKNVQDAAARHVQPGVVRVSRAERLRFLRLLEATFPKPVDGFQHLPRSREFGA